MLTLPAVACIFVETLRTTGVGELRLDQHDYAHAIDSLQCLSSARDDQALPNCEVSGLRGLSGSLQWLATQTIPRIQANFRSCSEERHTVGTMRKLNKFLPSGPAVLFSALGSFLVIRLLVWEPTQTPAWAVRRKGENLAGYLKCLADAEDTTRREGPLSLAQRKMSTDRAQLSFGRRAGCG